MPPQNVTEPRLQENRVKVADYAGVPEAFAYAEPPLFDDAEAAPLLCAGIIGYRAL